MDQRLTIITLGVRDLKAATQFYRDQFGWKTTGGSDEHISFFHLNGIELALFEKSELAKDAGVGSKGEGFRQFTLAYNTRSENEVDQLFGEFQRKGATIVKQPAKAFWGGYSGYIGDPDGHIWEIAFNPYLLLDDAGNTLENP